MMKIKHALICIAALLLSAPAFAADFYINPATPASCSLYQISAAVKAEHALGHDVNIFLTGVYNGSSNGCPGTSGSVGRIDMFGLFGSNSGPGIIVIAGGGTAQVTSIFSQNSGHNKVSNIVIDGLKIVASSEKAISICGDNWTVRSSDISHGADATKGPLVLIVPTADGQHEGSSEWCPPSKNILIENNVIHDSNSELIYVGGAGCEIRPDAAGSFPNCQVFPAHDGITIRNNKLFNGGIWGGEGDGIDIKAGLTNVTATGNEIYSLSPGSRAIVTQGQNSTGPLQNNRFEGNNIHDCAPQDAAIALSDSWGTPNGVAVVNNVVTNCGTPVRVYSGTNIVNAGNGPGVPIPPIVILPPVVIPPPVVVDTPPVPGGLGIITVTSASSSSLVLSWQLATDDQAGLLYQVEKNGVVIKPYTPLLSTFKVTGLKVSQGPIFTVTVKDSAGQTATYKTTTTPSGYGWH